jgi:hypothetical protein
LSESIDRRKFLGQSLAAALAVEIATLHALAATNVESLLAVVDPRLIHAGPAVPDNRNAFLLIERLVKGLTEEPPYDPLFDEDWEYGDAFNPQKPNPERDRLWGDWADANPQVVEQLEAALQLEGCEYPRGRWAGAEMELAGPMRALARLLLIQARRAIVQANYAEAMRIAVLGITTFRRLRLGGGVYVEYLLGSAAELSLLPVFGHLAGSAECDATLLRETLKRMPRDSQSREGLRRSLQEEFTRFYLPEMARLSECDRDSLFEELAQDCGLLPSKDECAAAVRALRAVFKDHPRPFDAEATVKLASARSVAILDDLELPWRAFKARPEREQFPQLQEWPAEVPLSILGNAEPEKLSDAQLSQIRAALAKVDNPIGKKMLQDSSIDSELTLRVAANEQARYDGWRLIVALGTFEREHGRLPETLESLREAKLLDVLPLDPYSDSPLAYSAADRAVWSIGPDGTNSSQPVADDDDANDLHSLLVWRLPELK